MAVGGWFSGGAQSSLLHAYLETSGGACTETALSDHTDGNGKYCHLDTWHRLCRSKATRTAGTVRALTRSFSAKCVSVVTRTHSYLKHSTILRAVSVKATPVEDQHKQRRPSSNWQRCQHPTKQQPQKRSDGGADATKEPVYVDNGVERRTAWMPALCAGVVAVLCYVNSLDGDFVHDDMVAVVGNPDVTGENRRHATSSSLSSLWMNDFWGRPMADPRSHKSYRPLTVLTFRANYYINGQQVRGYHVVNVTLHCACSVLVAVVARRVMRIAALHACLAAMLFAAHPVHTEAVSSIVGRAEVLCCLFFLLSLLCYHRCQRSRDVQGGHERLKWLAACGLLSVCALLSKEQGITVLPLCMALRVCTLVCDYMHAEQETRCHKAQCRKWPVCRYCIRDIAHRCITDCELVKLTALTILLLCFRLCILQGSLPEFSEMDNPASFSSASATRLLTYSYLCAFNAWLVLCPHTLSYDWQMGSIPLVTSPSDCRNLATLALLASLLTLGWRALTTIKMKSSPAGGSREQLCCYNNNERLRGHSLRLLVPLFLTVLPFLPASNLFVTVGFVVAERVLYIPSIGVTLLVAEGMSRLHTWCSRVLRWCPTSVCFILVVLFAARTWNRNGVWTSRKALLCATV